MRSGRPPREGWTARAILNRKIASALRGRRSGRAPMVAALGHELVELGLVLRHAQASQEFAELALLLFQALQGLGAIFVECPVAARTRRRLPPRPGSAHGVGACVPAAHAATFPATH